MNNDKAPRPNGFPSNFFQASQSIMGEDVYPEVGEFNKLEARPNDLNLLHPTKN